jgi:hypothetical protein
MFDGTAIAAAELDFREDLWRTAPIDAVEEAAVRYKRFGPILATVFGELPDVSILHVVQGAAEPEGVSRGHLAAAVEWLRTWEVDYRVSVAGDRPGTKHAEDWLSTRGYEPGSTIRRYVHTAPTTATIRADGVEIRNLRTPETERVDDEHLGPVSLGDLVHLRVRTALDQERVVFPTDPLQAVEEVTDQLDLEVLDPMERHVLDRGPLVAGSRRPEGYQRDLSPTFVAWPHLDNQD